MKKIIQTIWGTTKRKVIAASVIVFIILFVLSNIIYDNWKCQDTIDYVTSQISEIIKCIDSLEKQISGPFIVNGENRYYSFGIESDLLSMEHSVLLINQHYSLGKDYATKIDETVKKLTDYDKWKDYQEFIIKNYLPYDDYKENAKKYINRE